MNCFRKRHLLVIAVLGVLLALLFLSLPVHASPQDLESFSYTPGVFSSGQPVYPTAVLPLAALKSLISQPVIKAAMSRTLPTKQLALERSQVSSFVRQTNSLDAVNGLNTIFKLVYGQACQCLDVSPPLVS